MIKIINTTRIDNCDVTLQEEEGTISCLIEHGDYCSSLSVAEDFGTLEGSSDRVSYFYEIDPRTVAKIRTWAEEYGY
jgi:hypothetical protein